MRGTTPSSSLAWISTAAIAMVPSLAVATEYMSAADAQKLMFPAASAFSPRLVALSAEQAQRFKAKAGANAVTGFMQVQAALAGDQLLGYVVTDRVIGKFELIDYAVAINPRGEVLDLEILAYREAHGGEVRTKAWRGQFVGKTADAAIAVGTDIANISGATLSCTHLADGVRRVVDYVQIAFIKP